MNFAICCDLCSINNTCPEIEILHEQGEGEGVRVSNISIGIKH